MGGFERAPQSSMASSQNQVVAARVLDDLIAVGGEIRAGGTEENGFAHKAAA